MTEKAELTGCPECGGDEYIRRTGATEIFGVDDGKLYYRRTRQASYSCRDIVCRECEAPAPPEFGEPRY